MNNEHVLADLAPSIPHADLKYAIEQAELFLTQNPEINRYLLQESQKIASLIFTTVPGIREVSGVGFPHYYAGLNTANASNEIRRHLKETTKKIQVDEKINPDGWPCPACQDAFDHPDLRTFCRDCPIVFVKPREIFRSLPDIDIITIGDDDEESVLRILENAVQAIGYHSSDKDIRTSFYETLNNMTGGETKLPIDLHFMKTTQLFESLRRMREGELNITLETRSLHKQWEVYNLPFGFDFIFSFTSLINSDNEISREIKETRCALLQRFGIDGLSSFVRKISANALRLMEDVKLEELLRNKFNQWNIL